MSTFTHSSLTHPSTPRVKTLTKHQERKKMVYKLRRADRKKRKKEPKLQTRNAKKRGEENDNKTLFSWKTVMQQSVKKRKMERRERRKEGTELIDKKCKRNKARQMKTRHYSPGRQ